MDIYGCTEPAERGLRCYLERVAAGLGIGPESACCELACPATAYLALDERPVDLPGWDAALVWDDERGWALGVENSGRKELRVLAWYGLEVVPQPEEVVRFAKSVLGGHRPRSPGRPAGSPEWVRAQLETYVPTG
ncbi:DUF6292 family protein [Amycolatopsis aidingensis]|uniref:DUF6292 family protein n=1 Tax=Amycolatopsis aidingensis TaxID=2842453 RepID=UPI001E4F0495|nr:DUF6292 family protein [Amycolatopsis aidingensis]